MDLPRAQAHSDAVPIGRAVDGCSLYFNANLPMQESSQRTTIERIKKDFRLNARLRHSVGAWPFFNFGKVSVGAL
jgi:hypothetical protein